MGEEQDKEQVLIFWKPGCEKCKIAKEIGSKLKDKGHSVKLYNIETADGLSEFTYHGFRYTPGIVFGDKKYESVKLAEKELLK